MQMFCVVVVHIQLQDISCSRALRFYFARAVPQEIYEMPSLTDRSHKAASSDYLYNLVIHGNASTMINVTILQKEW